MSTNNFSFENILVVAPDFNLTDEDGGYIEFDEYQYKFWVEDIQSQLEGIGFESCDKYEEDRNYGGRIIAKWGLEDNDGMIKWLEVVVRNGYYEGMNIDYTIDGDFGVNEHNKKSIAHYEAMNRKFDRQVVKLEKILRGCGTEMLKVAQLSNGEAVYEIKK